MGVSSGVGTIGIPVLDLAGIVQFAVVVVVVVLVEVFVAIKKKMMMMKEKLEMI
jgi:hypothetical protein